MGSKTTISSLPKVGWQELRSRPEYRGRWVALDKVRYDAVTAQPVDGEVVDTDDDLASLCSRMRSADRTSCAIVHCDDQPSIRMAARPSAAPARLPRLQH
jgi:hypothetical protein